MGQYASESMTHWGNEENQQIKINLDLRFSHELMEASEKAGDDTVLANVEHLRETVFHTMMDQVVPQIVLDSPFPPQHALNPLTTHAEINNQSSTNSSVENNTLSTNSKLHLNIDLNSDHAVNPAQELMNARGTVAASVADIIVHDVQNIYGKKPYSRIKYNHDSGTDNYNVDVID